MRCIGMAERGLELMISRVTDPSRRTFGKNLSEHGTVIADIATSRIEIDQARFLVLSAAKKIDEAKAKGAMKEISMAKVNRPKCCNFGVVLTVFPCRSLLQPCCWTYWTAQCKHTVLEEFHRILLLLTFTLQLVLSVTLTVQMR